MKVWSLENLNEVTEISLKVCMSLAIQINFLISVT